MQLKGSPEINIDSREITKCATKRAPLILLLIMTVITLSGCGDSGDVKVSNETSLSTDTVPPTISATYPADGATGFAVNSAITATFSEAMDASTISTTTFSLSGGVTGTVTYDATNMIATFTPSSSFSFSTPYTATITTGVKDAAGNPMAANYTWTFTTGAAPDTTPPTVLSTSPIDGATGVAINTAITATFSETMDVSTITSATFTVDGVTGTVTYNGTTATFTPSSSLSFSTPYTATITTGVKDAADNPMAANYTWAFTTSGSAILTWDAPTINVDGTPLTDLAGYKIYYGTSSGSYTTTIDAGNVTTYTVTGLSTGTYYFALTAVDALGNESNYSNEVSRVIP